ncbi:protein transport protein Sec31A-like [Sinocyclocheilus rhinocerous]|uniref:protein transport protein Sec31A-like n=1 Tax=Sinocyclocheilus rhinocerous TaxID=307959 RepID=UPI0007B9B25F|nr:PREDICTED: protein transport protein Sec31A-like [Sinocyclocheilus rhinocerous]
MRVKEILRTATQAWSPATKHPVYLALGTAAQQLDASFNTSAALEIFEMDFADSSMDMKLRGTLPTSNRFHSLIWVAFDMEVKGSSGRLIGGSESGTVTVFSPDAILSAGEDAVIGQSNKHTGPVLALDYNRFQSNLIASGASDSEIYIWDLNNFSNPMTPGTKSQLCEPAEDVSVVAWNSQVQHILASANPSGKAIVWDLRKNEPIIKISDHSNRISASFDTSDPFGTGQTLPPLQVPQPSVETTIIPPLKKPPKWVRRPVGASFAFGGKLVTFESPNVAPQQQQPIRRQVHVSQVTTETEFLQRSDELQAALQSGSFSSYCHGKISSAPSDAEQDIWRFLMVNFEDEARVKFLRLLGFSKDELQRKISACLGRKLHPNGLDVNDLAEKMQTLSDQRADESDGLSGRESPSDFFSQLPKKEKDRAPFQIPVSSDTDGLISQALLVGNFEAAVDLCLNDGRFAEAILLSISGGEELLKKTQQRYLHQQTNSVSMVTTYDHYFICSGNIERLVECWTSQRDCSSPLALEDLVEKVMILRKSIERLRSGEVCVQSSALTEKLIQYSSILASQGSLSSALRYLPDSPDQHTPAAHTLGPYGSAAPPQMQQMMPRLFTPQPRPDPAAPAGAPPSSLRPCVYPQHPATAPGFAPSQPFAQSGSFGAPVGFMSGPSMSGPSMSGPSVPPSSPPGPMMPAPPGPGFLSPTSLPWFPAAPPGGAYLPLGAGYPQGGPGAPGAKIFSGAGVPPPPTGYFPWLMCHTEEEVQDGWNDPPAVRAGQRKKKLPENYTPPAPITAPVMGFPVETPVPQDRIQVPPGAPQEPSVQSLQQLPAEHVEQKEIPAEHMILKTTFSSLVQRCQLAAADPQTKRKLDDASKRLESLYDKLRDQALSPSILGGLHEISRCVSVRNYQQGLEVHTQVVSSSNFSEISAFMPVLKVLMTIGNKLAV